MPLHRICRFKLLCFACWNLVCSLTWEALGMVHVYCVGPENIRWLCNCSLQNKQKEAKGKGNEGTKSEMIEKNGEVQINKKTNSTQQASLTKRQNPILRFLHCRFSFLAHASSRWNVVSIPSRVSGTQFLPSIMSPTLFVS